MQSVTYSMRASSGNIDHAPESASDEEYKSPPNMRFIVRVNGVIVYTVYTAGASADIWSELALKCEFGGAAESYNIRCPSNNIAINYRNGKIDFGIDSGSSVNLCAVPAKDAAVAFRWAAYQTGKWLSTYDETCE